MAFEEQKQLLESSGRTLRGVSSQQADDVGDRTQGEGRQHHQALFPGMNGFGRLRVEKHSEKRREPGSVAGVY